MSEKLTEDEYILIKTATTNLSDSIDNLKYAISEFIDVIDEICK